MACSYSQLHARRIRWIVLVVAVGVVFYVRHDLLPSRQLASETGVGRALFGTLPNRTRLLSASSASSQTKRFSLVPSSCTYDAGFFDEVYTTARWIKYKKADDFLQPAYYYSYGSEKRDPFKRNSLSGQGSNIGYASATSLNFLSTIIQEKGIRTMLDVPCGDVNWQMSSWEIDSLDLYVGLDVAKVAINLDQKRFTHHSNKAFAPWDFSACTLPGFVSSEQAGDLSVTGISFDLVHVRDVIQHMPIDKGVAAACNIVRSGIKYFVGTSFPGGDNQKAHTKESQRAYLNNLQRPPFNFPKPDRCVWTHPKIEQDQTCLWILTPDVTAALAQKLCINTPFGDGAPNKGIPFTSMEQRMPIKSFSLTPSTCSFDDSFFDNVYKSARWIKYQKADSFLKPPYYYSYGIDKRHPFKRNSLSGLGSNLGYPTATSIQFLKEVITQNGIRTMLDVPCGDANWQMSSWEVDSLQLYAGLDVSKTAIDLDKRRFTHHSNKVFAAWDFAACALPKIVQLGTTEKTTFDMVHARDVIQHMPINKGVAALCNIVRSGIKYFVGTTFPGGNNRNGHSDASSKAYANNLLQPPFNFPKPERCVNTHTKIEADQTCLWIITPEVASSLSQSLCSN